MHRTRFAALITLLLALPGNGQDHADIPTLQEARETGREDSRFLKPEGVPSDPKKAPKPNLADYKKSLYPIIKKS